MACPGLSTVAMIAVAITSAAPAATPDPALTFSAVDTGENIHEVTVRGTRFTSREAVESRLLLETARFTLANRREWFRLLPLPGEQTTTPPGPIAAYPAWHSEWCYKLKGERWLAWRAQSAARFWAGDIDPARLEAFEASALVELGSATAENGAGVFDAGSVVRGLQSGDAASRN